VKQMLHEWERQYPGRTQTIFTAMQNVRPSHLLDPELFDFVNLKLGDAVGEGDIAFDS
jgi:tRNA 2-thiocytidine biosynthesis protein TtcA